MSHSPISATPYEVLGVSPTAGDEQLRRAYRALLRQTHPDTGGTSAGFVAVQRAWELVGTPAERAAYDRGNPPAAAGRRDSSSASPWAPTPPSRPDGSRPAARSQGAPGLRCRALYESRIRVERGMDADDSPSQLNGSRPSNSHSFDPYDVTVVRAASLELRLVLAHALAQEEDARRLSELGMGYTLWHEMVGREPGSDEDTTIDHVVLGPTGLFVVASTDWGIRVSGRQGELYGEDAALPVQPMADLSWASRIVSRSAGVQVTGLVVVVPDGTSPEPISVVGTRRGADCLLVQRSQLAHLLRVGLEEWPRKGGPELFDMRTRLQSIAR